MHIHRGIDQIFNAVDKEQNEILTFFETKRQLDEVRDKLLSKIDEDAVGHHAIIQELWRSYQEEYRFLNSSRKKMIELDILGQRAEQVAKDTGYLKWGFSLLRFRKPEVGLQRIGMAKHAKKRLKMFAKESRKAFDRIFHGFEEQLLLLKRLKDRPDDPHLLSSFILSCKNEERHIKQFYRRGVSDRFMHLVSRIHPAHGALMILWSQAPGAALVIPLSAPFIGVYPAVRLGILVEIVKWSTLALYSLYLYRTRIKG
ncbi:MAG: hypothetical protein ABIH34_06110 [Nanoarchaeota archaeon]